MKGKDKCTLLKQIRCTVARANNIDYAPTECTYQGECRGTCPKCEAELKYITTELEKIKRSGKQIAVAGVAAAVIATNVAGCKSMGTKPPGETAQSYSELESGTAGQGGSEQVEMLEGDVAYFEPENENDGNFAEEKGNLEDDCTVTTVPEEDVNVDELEDHEPTEGDVIIRGETTEGDVGYPIEEEFEGNFFIPDEEKVLTGTTAYEPEDVSPDIQIPTLQEAVKMSSEQLKPYVVGLNRDDVRRIWDAQTPLQQPSTFNGFDEYWIDLTGIHLFFDDNLTITDAEVFIVEDCSSSDFLAP